MFIFWKCSYSKGLSLVGQIIFNMSFSMISIYSSDQLHTESSVRVLLDRAVLGLCKRTCGKMHQIKISDKIIYYILKRTEVTPSQL